TVTSQDLQYDSPYNTYKYRGLPPGPIGNPGRAAIEAALEPAKGTWLFFVTTDPHRKITKFATTYEEQLELEKEFRAWQRKNPGN
ncbi:MAG TPA: endolytic transglycosylase MltG, partial [Spirillospora sp.]